MRKGRDGEKNGEKKMIFIVVTNVIASRPPERQTTGMPHARAKNLTIMYRWKSKQFSILFQITAAYLYFPFSFDVQLKKMSVVILSDLEHTKYLLYLKDAPRVFLGCFEYTLWLFLRVFHGCFDVGWLE